MEKIIAYKSNNGRLFETKEKCLAYENKIAQFPKVTEITTQALGKYLVGGKYVKTDIVKHVMCCPNCGHVDGDGEEEVNEEGLVCFEVETKYKSGRKKTDVLTFKDEEIMWAYYDKHHDKGLIEYSIITDAWSY